MKDELKHSINHLYCGWLKYRGHGPRAGQQRMIKEVAATCAAAEREDTERPLLAVEAPPGTGKTIAYLSAAIPSARALDRKLLISTSTIALQEQLVHEDIPQLQAASKDKFGFALAKGRERYLCRLRLEQVLDETGEPQQQDLYPDDASADQVTPSQRKLYRQMSEDVEKAAWDGDKDNWKEAVGSGTWQRVTASARQCSGSSCTHYRNCCFYEARRRLYAEDVICIVANHDLVLSDLLLADGAVLPKPEDTIYIFDEAHHLGDKAISRFAREERASSGRSWLERCEKRLEKLTEALSDMGSEYAAPMPAAELFSRLREQNENLFEELAGITENGTAAQLEKTRPYVFRLDEVHFLREMAEQAAEGFKELASAMAKIRERLDKILAATAAIDAGQQAEEMQRRRGLAERWLPVLGDFTGQAQRWQSLWLDYAKENPEEAAPTARWVMTVEGKGEERDLLVATSPVQGAEILGEGLWNRCAGAVLTSATLSMAGDFKRLVQHTGLPGHSRTVVIEHAFDYPKAAALSIPRQGFNPRDQSAHTKEVTEYLAEHLPAQLDSGTGTLVLFASRWQMNRVREELSAALQNRLLVQDDYQRQELVRLHEERVQAGTGSIIFGLASFAEGVDLPGALCTLVIIAKLPFAAPSPISKTLDNWIQSQGGNPFLDIAVQDTALRLVQACGRLLRSEKDTGRIVLLDSRILNTSYGQRMLQALPPFRQEKF